MPSLANSASTQSIGRPDQASVSCRQLRPHKGPPDSKRSHLPFRHTFHPQCVENNPALACTCTNERRFLLHPPPNPVSARQPLHINWHHRADGTDGHTERTALQELDFGTIMCWAENVVGQQKEPCVFHLIAAGKPDAPYNCSLVNQTSESLEVDCSEGKRLVRRTLFHRPTPHSHSQ